jgi:glycosyltransferase involved in cell wall biosynthesis
MKVLMLTPSYSPIVGGTETAVKNLAINLNKIGIKTDVMTFNMDKKWEPIWKWEIKKEDGVTVFRIPACNLFKQMPNPLRHFLKISVIPDLSFRKILKGYDILHFHDDLDLTFPIFSWFVKKPKVFHCHSLQGNFHSYKRNIICKTMFRKSFDAYLAVSNESGRLAKKLGANNVFILHNGVDIEEYKHRFHEFNEPIGKNILFVGRLDPIKGIQYLLRAMEIVCKVLPEAKLILVGDGKERENLENLTKILGLSDCVTFVGMIPHKKIPDYMDLADIFVLPSLSEGFPIVIPEAMAGGLPIVATRVGGVPDIIEDGVNGYMVEPGNFQEMANKIISILENQPLKCLISKNNRMKVEEFEWKKIVNQLECIYLEIT